MQICHFLVLLASDVASVRDQGRSTKDTQEDFFLAMKLDLHGLEEILGLGLGLASPQHVSHVGDLQAAKPNVSLASHKTTDLPHFLCEVQIGPFPVFGRTVGYSCG